MRKPNRSCFRNISTMAAARPRAIIRSRRKRGDRGHCQGRDRVLLVMAGTGKTYTAFQIIWRLWKAGHKKRILFLADATYRSTRLTSSIVGRPRQVGSVPFDCVRSAE
jgi:type I site-specific restriction endonuclease